MEQLGTKLFSNTFKMLKASLVKKIYKQFNNFRLLLLLGASTTESNPEINEVFLVFL